MQMILKKIYFSEFYWFICTDAYFPFIESVAPITDHMTLKARDHLKTHIYDKKADSV